jgi:hypothetical protein
MKNILLRCTCGCGKSIEVAERKENSRIKAVGCIVINDINDCSLFGFTEKQRKQLVKALSK